MTLSSPRNSLLVKIKKPLRKKLGACYMCVILLVLFFKNTDASAAWVRQGLELCAKRLIPSLFPFMAISSLMVQSGAGEKIFKIFERPICRIFGVGSSCCAPILLGWLCGFPIGAKCASRLLSLGAVDLEEYKRILCISSTPSPAFLIGAVGTGMLNSTQAGILLYIISLSASVVIGISINMLSGRVERKSASRPHHTNTSFAVCLTRAVTESSASMLYVCGFVVFFSAFLGALDGILCITGASDTCKAVIFCFFEITSGLSRLCSLALPSFPLMAMAVGWSGLSVHFQTAAMCDTEKKGLGAYLISHTARAAICLALGCIASIFL